MWRALGWSSAAREAGVEIRCAVDIWGAFGAHELIGTESGLVRRFNPQRLIVATGAYERGVPLPGWTLPGVMTTGAAQTLWRSYRRLAGKRILIAGNGPLNLQVASELAAGGADIAAVVEIAPVSATRAAGPPAHVRRGAAARRRRPEIPREAGESAPHLRVGCIAYRARSARACRSCRAVTREWRRREGVRGRRGLPRLWLRAVERDPARARLPPRLRPARGQFIAIVDEDGRTSVADVFAIGDCTGLGGARVALAEGAIVGSAAAADLGPSWRDARRVEKARRSLERHRRFQAALWRFYAAPRLGLELATPDTIICRCEEITLAQIEAALADGRPLDRRSEAGDARRHGAVPGPLLRSDPLAVAGSAPGEGARRRHALCAPHADQAGGDRRHCAVAHGRDHASSELAGNRRPRHRRRRRRHCDRRLSREGGRRGCGDRCRLCRRHDRECRQPARADAERLPAALSTSRAEPRKVSATSTSSQSPIGRRSRRSSAPIAR